jgi:hypothetical protein
LEENKVADKTDDKTAKKARLELDRISAQEQEKNCFK